MSGTVSRSDAFNSGNVSSVCGIRIERHEQDDAFIRQENLEEHLQAEPADWRYWHDQETACVPTKWVEIIVQSDYHLIGAIDMTKKPPMYLLNESKKLYNLINTWLALLTWPRNRLYTKCVVAIYVQHAINFQKIKTLANLFWELI